MWANHVNFLPIIIKVLPSHSNAFSLLNLKKYMDQIRVKLKNWLDRNCNKSNRNHSPNQMQRSISLLQQQSKQEWIKYGDANSRLFFAKSKQRKLATYIYSIKDDTGTWVEGFVKVGQVMLNFYKDLLGHHPTTGSPIDPAIIQLGPQLSKEQQVALCKPFTVEDVKLALFFIPNTKSPGPDGFSSAFYKHTWGVTKDMICSVKSQMVFGGVNPQLQQACLHTVGLNSNSFPLKYLGVLIVSSKLTKIGCNALVEKITTRVHT
ncbi:hypothetical protein Cgig2_008478 [Carnegiea gigantea]|uniref:Reverse transcriptase n=1 Tax=Carnegiea gigantea TaxID=171969 RepID=A0A9Q1GRR5_9CARY|nr:hypothetical protein Cgig2_008478 [Carnegiea gigantea]